MPINSHNEKTIILLILLKIKVPVGGVYNPNKNNG